MLPTYGNTLYYGDNLPVLRDYLSDASVDLVYLDPPFNSNRNYNILFKDEHGLEADAQIQAFEDTWHWNDTSARLYHELASEGPVEVGQLVGALRYLLGTNQMLAYLVMMAARLVELHRVLKPTGSLYLHCDPTASHYLKIILDSIFGVKNFRNEIIWGYSGGGVSAKDFPRKHDTILRYSKTDTYSYTPIYRPYTRGTIQRGRTQVKGGSTLNEDGTPITDWWFSNLECDNCGHKLVGNLKRIASPTDPEKLGYPTQKPLALLERIIQSSSNPGDVVLDPFCGCGTAVAAAEKLGRRWIGIDVTHLAISVMKSRMLEMFPGATFQIIGEPKDIGSARALAGQDRYQFQWWALSLVKARPLGGEGKQGKKGADRGIDGIIPFLDDTTERPKRALVQVKSGHVRAGDIRDLRGTIEREQAQLGAFLTLEPPSRDMLAEAAAAGFYRSPGWQRDYPRIQVLTIEDLLSGRATVKMPPAYAPFKQAQRLGEQGEQGRFGW